MLNKERLMHVYMVFYLLMVGMVSFTAFNSPFMMENYTWFILINSFILLLSSTYIVSWKHIRTWWRTSITDAKIRAAYREEIKEELKKKYGKYAD